MPKLFSNFNPNISKSGIFSPKLKDFYFCTNLCSKTNSRTKISIMAIVFSNYNRKISKSGIFCPNLAIFVFSLNSVIRKIQDGVFKYENIVFKFLPKNNQI